MAQICECGCGEETPPIARTHTAKGRLKGEPNRFLHGHNGRLTGLKQLPSCPDCGGVVSREGKRCVPCSADARLKNPSRPAKSTCTRRAKKHLKESCERCGETAELEAHHRDKNRANNDPANIETLCDPCHRAHHAESG